MTTETRELVERLKEDAEEIAGWGAGNEAGRVRQAAATITRLTEEVERLRGLLIDPGDPAWEDARAVVVAELRKHGMVTHADNIEVAHGVPIPSWIALNLIASAARATLARSGSHG